jgi:hypothetical protein
MPAHTTAQTLIAATPKQKAPFHDNRHTCLLYLTRSNSSLFHIMYHSFSIFLFGRGGRGGDERYDTLAALGRSAHATRTDQKCSIGLRGALCFIAAVNPNQAMHSLLMAYIQSSCFASTKRQGISICREIPCIHPAVGATSRNKGWGMGVASYGLECTIGSQEHRCLGGKSGTFWSLQNGRSNSHDMAFATGALWLLRKH